MILLMSPRYCNIPKSVHKTTIFHKVTFLLTQGNRWHFSLLLILLHLKYFPLGGATSTRKQECQAFVVETGE